MATNNRSGSTRGSNNRGSGNHGRRATNNNPQGHNQYDRGWFDSARERPVAAAVTAAAAVGAGVFLWSKRNQISDQISNLSDQISEWRDGLGSEGQFTATDEDQTDSFVASRGKGRSQSDIAEEALTLKETGRKTKGSGPVTANQTTTSVTA